MMPARPCAMVSWISAASRRRSSATPASRAWTRSWACRPAFSSRACSRRALASSSSAMVAALSRVLGLLETEVGEDEGERDVEGEERAEGDPLQALGGRQAAGLRARHGHGGGEQPGHAAAARAADGRRRSSRGPRRTAKNGFSQVSAKPSAQRVRRSRPGSPRRARAGRDRSCSTTAAGRARPRRVPRSRTSRHGSCTNRSAVTAAEQRGEAQQGVRAPAEEPVSPARSAVVSLAIAPRLVHVLIRPVTPTGTSGRRGDQQHRPQRQDPEMGPAGPVARRRLVQRLRRRRRTG